MLKLIIVMHLTVHNCDTGDLLYQKTKVMDALSTMEDCIKDGAGMALPIAMHYREMFPNASANVSCEWEIPNER